MYMKRFYFLTIAFMALSLIIGCKNKKSNIEQPKEDDIEQEDWVITGPRPEPGRELTLKEKSLMTDGYLKARKVLTDTMSILTNPVKLRSLFTVKN